MGGGLTSVVYYFLWALYVGNDNSLRRGGAGTLAPIFGNLVTPILLKRRQLLQNGAVSGGQEGRVSGFC
jgi:hypothetical protein